MARIDNTTWQLLRRYVASHWLLVASSTVVAIIVLFGLASLVVARLHRDSAIAAKESADQEIARIASTIDAGSDPGSVVALEEQLRVAVSQAQRAGTVLESLGLTEMAGPPGDEFDVHLHAVLATLDADTYAIPPSFREETRRQVAQIAASRNLERMLRQKKGSVARDRRRAASP